MPEPKHIRVRMTAQHASEDPSYKHLQEELSDQQKQLASTREKVEKRRTDLRQSELDARRSEWSELAASTARTRREN